MDDDNDPLARQVGDAQRVREIFDEMPIALVGLDGPDHRFVAANAAYRAFTGRSDLIGATIRDVFPEAEGQQIFELFDRVFASGNAEAIHEWRVQLNSGPAGELEEQYANMSVTPRSTAEGTVFGVTVYLTDVTAQVRERQVAQRRAAEAERRYRAARDVVTELQEALLPTALPVLPGVSIAARYLVAARDQAAGGDWFDAVPLADGRVALVVGDIVGHGVAASAAMGQLRAVLGELLAETGDMDVALRRADRMAAHVPTLRAATVCVAVLDPTSGDLRYSTCGHPPPLIVAVDHSTRYLVPTGGGPLGTGAEPISHSARLEPGEVVLLYSDGLVERPGQSLQDGLNLLATIMSDAAANRVMPGGAPESVADRVCQTTVELMTRFGYDDDVTALALQRRTHPVAALHHDFVGEASAVADARAVLREWLAPVALDERDHTVIDTVVSELVANVVEHAYPTGRPGTARIDAALGMDGVLRLSVVDEGDWHAPGPVPPDISGRGLWMSATLVDEVRVEHAPDRPRGTAVTARHRLHHPAVLASEPTVSVPPPAPMEFQAVLGEGPERTVRVSGPVDITTAGTLAARIDVAGRGGVHPVVVDLCAVDVLASAGVKVLFAARERHVGQGTTLTLVATPGSVAAQVLELVGLRHTASWSGD